MPRARNRLPSPVRHEPFPYALTDWVRRLCGIQLGRLRVYSPRPLVLPADHTGESDGEPSLRIALVTPVLNQVQFIEAAIRSVESQRYGKLDYVVKDGGSADGTLERARQVCGDVGRVLSCPDSGLAQALNQGFATVHGDVLGWLNGDDVLLPGALRYVARFLGDHPEIDVVYGHRIVIDENGAEIGRWLLPPHDGRVLSYADYVPQETLFWRRTLWDRVGARIDESFRFAVDWDLLIRFREAGARFVRLPRFLGAFRAHAAQKSVREMADLGAAEKARIWMRTLGHLPSRWELARGTAAYLGRHAAQNVLQRVRS